tara:strand:- start:154 stop:2166 length:2013 start_codon:yes stop_codon:yes gene_type:complete
MPIARVEMPDGRIGRFEFPEGTKPEEVEAFIAAQQTQTGQPSQLGDINIPPASDGDDDNIELGPEVSAPSQDPVQPQFEDETKFLDPNIEKRGLIVPGGVNKETGESEFALPQIAVDVLKAVMLPGQVLKGKNATQSEILNFVTSFGPSALRGGGVAIKKAFDELPTAKAAEDELTAAIKAVDAGSPRPPGTPSLDELRTMERAARFKEQNISSTRGDITQDFAQQAEESKLLSMAGGEKAEPLRQAKLVQSEEFKTASDDLVNSLGVPDRAGTSIKDALSGRKTLLRKEKNKLYTEVAESAPEVLNVPIFTDDIVKALPDADTLEDIAIVGANVDGLKKAMIRFGINKNQVDVDAFIKGGGTVTPLKLGNFERFRKLLNGLERADQTGSVKVATGPIKRALDEEASFIDDAIKESGITDTGIITTLKEARSRVRTLKTEFSKESTVGKLINVKRDGVTPVVEASKVANDLLRANAPIENLQRTLASLRASGAKGKVAIQDLQASVVMDALEAALKAPSRKTSGIETIGGNQFAKALDKFGADKLDALFKGNEAGLNRLLNLRQTALDITPTAGAVPKGSAPVILDLINKAATVRGLAAVVDAAKFIINAGKDEKAIAKALNTKPAIKRTMNMMRRDFPTIAERLGIIGILDSQKESIENRKQAEDPGLA